MLSTCLANLREKSPLVHSITNFVTVNDCANLLLACGARPIMASDPQEAAEITAAADALNINIGTLNHLLVPAMLDAGRTANRLGIPVLLDPVGVGASSLRRQTVAQLLKELKLTAIRANASEIRAIARLEQAQPSGPSAGVDALPDDLVTKEQLGQNIKLARQLAEKLGCIILLTGPVDIVTDGKKAVCIYNGHPMMSRITGAGCQLSALTAAFLAANPDSPLDAAAAAVCTMGLSGQLAFERMKPGDGNASFRTYLIDAVFCMTPEQLQRGADYEIR